MQHFFNPLYEIVRRIPFPPTIQHPSPFSQDKNRDLIIYYNTMGAALILGKDILRTRDQSRVMRGIVLRGTRNRNRFFSLK